MKYIMKESDKKKLAEIEDLSGKDRVVKNVITSWGSHFVLIIIGFIMPRMIHEHLGQISLGIWDLSWSFVNYLSLSGLGVGSSVNRYVAKYRSRNDYLSLNKALSSVVFIQMLITLTVIAGTGVLVWMLPSLVSGHEGVDVSQARWVVGLLGLSLAAQMAFDTSRGLLTGMHRWDLYNALNAGSHILIAVLMIVVMLMGGGLIGLAVAYFIITFLAEAARSIIATRLCVGLDLKKEYINLRDMRKMFTFGAKTIISSAPSILVMQTVNIFVASTLGPSALAVYARPSALVRHVETFMNKYSFVLTPMVGSISASDDPDQLKRFLLQSTKYSVSFALPMILFMAILGDHVLNIWMGAEYARLNLIMVLSIGFFLPISQGPSLRVLMGMNRHGRVALINLVLTVVMLAIGLIWINLIGWELVYVAFLTSSIFTVTLGVITPIFTCRAIGMSYFEYLAKSYAVPLLCGGILTVWLIICRQWSNYSSLAILLIAMLGASVIVPMLYWHLIMPDTFKASIRKRFL